MIRLAETLADDHLEGVAGEDVFLDALNARLEFLAREVGDHAGVLVGVQFGFGAHPRRFLLERPRIAQPFQHELDLVHGGVVGLAWIAGHVRVGQQDHAPAHVIEDGELVGDHEVGVRQTQVVGVFLGQPLEAAHEVISHVANGAADKGRQVGIGGRAVALHELAQKSQWMRGRGRLALVDAVIRKVDLVAARADQHLGVKADERIAPDLLALLDALEQKGVFAVGQLAKNRNGCLHVGQDLAPDRDEVPLPAAFFESLKIRLDPHRCPWPPLVRSGFLNMRKPQCPQGFQHDTPARPRSSKNAAWCNTRPTNVRNS